MKNLLSRKSILLTILAVLFFTCFEANSAQKTCDLCHGNKTCYNCGGSGVGGRTYMMGQWHVMPCFACNGTGVCPGCHGTGVYIQPSSNSYGRGGSSSGRSGSSSGSKSSGVCPECGGLGVRRQPMYENDPSGAAFHLRELVQHSDGTKCPICGKYNYHCHMKCYKCN